MEVQISLSIISSCNFDARDSDSSFQVLEVQIHHRNEHSIVGYHRLGSCHGVCLASVVYEWVPKNDDLENASSETKIAILDIYLKFQLGKCKKNTCFRKICGRHPTTQLE